MDFTISENLKRIRHDIEETRIKYRNPDDVVKIPDFGKSEKTEEVTLEEPVKAPETSQTEEPTTQETSPDLAARKKEVE